MDSDANCPDYDYIVFDVDGCRKVKDGKEYPMTEEEYRRDNPEHKDSGCTDCNFVQDRETLLTFLVPRELKDKATNKPLFVGKFTMPGWTGHSGFYLFRCKSCGRVSVDYPHGYTNFGLMFLRCNNDSCKETLPLEVTEEMAIYEKENAHIPKPIREERVKDLENTIASIESKGVRVIVPDLNREDSVQKGSCINFLNVGLVLLALYTLGIFLLSYWGILN